MYKEIFLLAFMSTSTVPVDSASVVCDQLLRLLNNKGRESSTLNRIRNAINQGCTLIDLIGYGINPLDILAPSNEVTKRTRRTTKTTTEGTTEAPPDFWSATAAPASWTTTTAPALWTTTAPPVLPAKTAPLNEQAVINVPSSTVDPIQVLLQHPQVNIIVGNRANGINGLWTSNAQSRLPSSRKFDTRVAVDAPRHLLPLHFEPQKLKRPYPAVYEVRTKFACDQQPYNPGVYADMSLGCKVFHLCVLTDSYHNRTSFYCPDTLLFHQEMLRCDYPKNVNCHESYKTFPINENFNKKFDIKYVILGKDN